MLQKIREKSQGTLSWFLLVGICVPFALWGIQNYVGGASEDAIATVGNRDFFQSDVNRAYQQYSQQFAQMNVDEATLRQQALLKLIKDEVLLQHVQTEGLTISDEDTKKYVQSLEYFQLEGKFSSTQYKSLLNSQGISSPQFFARIKKARVMEQYQLSILDSSFTTQYDIDNFFKIQNQQRDIEYLTVPVTAITETPAQETIDAYYQKHADSYKTEEQVSIEYISLSLDDLASKIAVTDEQIKTFYDEQKSLYTSKERRKVSHILFKFTNDSDEQIVLAKAQAAQKELATKTFEVLAAEVSDDTGTSKTGGDLGLFEEGGLEKALEDVVSKLKLNEVSAPVKSSFGYHLLKVTELVASETKPFEAVKAEVTKSLQRKEAETSFYEMSEKLAEVSYENPDNLTATADATGINISKSSLFSKNKGQDIAAEATIRSAAFSEDVLAGNNSEPIELGSDKVVVLRMLERKPASVRPLADVKDTIVATLLKEKSQIQTIEKANALKKQLMAGKNIQDLATENSLEVKNIAGLTRSNEILPSKIRQAIFKAAKPVDNKATVLIVGLTSGEQYIVSLNKITDGVMSESDKKQQKLAEKNIAKAFGEATFEAVLISLQANAEIAIKQASK